LAEPCLRGRESGLKTRHGFLLAEMVRDFNDERFRHFLTGID
jgi:hypothetical protein